MFCNQCEQAAHGTGCTKIGVCGKSPDVAALQDLLVHACRALSRAAVNAPAGFDLAVESALVEDALFTTLTNVDFDPQTIADKSVAVIDARDALVD
ncbi:MAG: hydroxylamine reductase, partial [Actinobacteria bacterium]